MKTTDYKEASKVFLRLTARLLPSAVAVTLVLALIALVAPSSPVVAGMGAAWWVIPVGAVLIISLAVTAVEVWLAVREGRAPGGNSAKMRIG